MPVQKITKTINAGSHHLWTGSGGNDTYIATSDIFRIRGGSGDDTLTGGSGSGTFIFESTRLSNGVDTITNFKVHSSTTTLQDTLGLSLVFDRSFSKLINGSNVGNYIWIENGELHLDTTGNHGSTSHDEIFAHLDGVEDGDQLHVRTAGFDGLITATADAALPVIDGSSLGETLNGTAASEAINGYAGADILSGGLGSDVLTGGIGADTVTGGQGADIFVFSSGDSPTTRGASGPNLYLYGGVDLIADFDDGSVSGEKDVLRIKEVDYDIQDISALIASGHVATVDSNGDFNLSGTAFVAGDTYIMFGTYSNTGTFTFTDSRTATPTGADAMLFFIAPSDPSAYSPNGSVISLYSFCDLGVVDFINPYTYSVV